MCTSYGSLILENKAFCNAVDLCILHLWITGSASSKSIIQQLLIPLVSKQSKHTFQSQKTQH